MPHFKYDADVDLANENTSHTLMVQLVGRDHEVLDVGCANGYLGKVLKGRGCTVAGVEVDAEAAAEAKAVLDEVVVGDIEALDLPDVLGAGRFDVVVFGDILEHVRDPVAVLRQAARLLKPEGFVVVSLPNVAHGSVRLALLRGEFQYRELGLLDSTHLRFFTRVTMGELFEQAGFAITELRRTTAGIFETELGMRREDFPSEVVALVEADPDAITYQFVVKAAPTGVR